MDKLATRSDLQQAETRLTGSISELRSEVHTKIKAMRSELRADMKVMRSEVHSEMKVMRWQLGAIFVCVVAPLLKMGFDMLSRT